MKELKKKFGPRLLSLMLVLGLGINAKAETIVETTDKNSNATVIPDGSIILGITRFSPGRILAHQALLAGAHYYAFVGDDNIGMYSYMQSENEDGSISDLWFKVGSDNNAGKASNEEISAMLNRGIYYVDNVEKQITINPSDVIYIPNGSSVVPLKNGVVDETRKNDVKFENGLIRMKATIRYLGVETSGEVTNILEVTPTSTSALAKTPIISYMVDGNVYEKVPQIAGQKYAIPSEVPTKIGHTFDGWEIDKNAVVTEDASINSLWTVNEYTLIFDAMGGASVNSKTIPYNQDMGAFPVSEKEGYDFNYWYKDSENTPYASTKMPSENVTLKASYTPHTYGVKYIANVPNDTEFPITSEFAEVTDMEFTYDTEKTLNGSVFVRPGYKLSGWALSSDGEIEYKANAKVKNLTSENNDTVNLYAVWTPLEFTVVYNANDEVGKDKVINKLKETRKTYKVGDSIENLDYTNTRSAHTFVGWAISTTSGALEEIPKTLPINSETNEFSNEVTLYAVWSNNDTISYEANFMLEKIPESASEELSYELDNKNSGLKTTLIDEEIASYGGYKYYHLDHVVVINNDGERNYNTTDIISLSENDRDAIVNYYYVRNTYTIQYDALGGYKNPTAMTGKYGDKYLLPSVSNLEAQYGAVWRIHGVDNVFGKAGDEKVFNENLLLDLKTDDLLFTLSFNTNGGNTINALTKKYNDVIELPEPTKAGYSFAGWYKGEVKIETATFTMLAENVELVAHWTAIPYTLSFNTSGGSVIDAVTNLTYGDSITEYISNANPTKDGYTFAGWYKGSTYENASDYKTMPNSNVTLYAKWTTNEYTLSFVTNGGSEIAGISRTVENSIPETLATVTTEKAGYAFAGWYIDEELTTPNTYENMPSQNVTLYAKWSPITYNVKYNANGGEGTIENTSHTYNENLDLNTNTTEGHMFTKVGYIFDGWSLSVDGAKLEGKNTLSTTQDEEVNVYARWVPITYQVAYNNNGGSGEIANTTHTYDTEINLDTNTTEGHIFTKVGYTFGGWSLEENGSAIENTLNTLTPTQGNTVTVYARWVPLTYNVKYNANGGEGTIENTTHTYNGNLNLDTNTTEGHMFTKVGYIFDGWSLTVDGAKLEGKNTLSTTQDEEVNVYARWVPITYQVAYNNNGGSGEIANTTHTYDTEINLDTNTTEGHIFTKVGYTFGGWSLEENGSAIESSLNTLTPTQDDTVTVYAVWVPITYTVKYHSNGGTGTISDTTHTYNTPINLSNGAELTKQGYAFVGWSLTENGDIINLEYNTLSVEKNATINVYAKYTPITYSINFIGGGGAMSPKNEDYQNIKDNLGIDYKNISYDSEISLEAMSTIMTDDSHKKPDATFKGWTTDSSALTAEFAPDDNIINLIDQNGETVNLYAVWK